jgi:NitT/TauT family transport system substrate-binding protein
MNAQSRIPEFVQKKVDAVGVYRSSDFPVIKEKLGSDFSVMDMTEFGLEVPGLAVVASDNGIEKNGDVLRRFLAVTDKAIEMARSDPGAAATALKAVWQAGPSDEVIREQVEATAKSIPTATGKPLGWIDEKEITDALQLIGSVERIGEPRPASSFYTNKLLTD